MTSATTSMTWSAFQRDAKTVAEQADEADVRLVRRDGPDLVLANFDRHEAIVEGLSVFSRMFAAAVAEPVVRSRLADVATVPWLHFLPEADREAFAVELAETAAAASSLGTLAPLAELIREWRTTALVHADPRLAAALRRGHEGTGELVPTPAE